MSRISLILAALVLSIIACSGQVPTQSSSNTETRSVSATRSTSPSLTPSNTNSPSVTPSWSRTPSVTPSYSPTPSVTPSNSRSPSVTPSNSKTETQSPSQSPSESVTPSVTPSQSTTPSGTPTQSRTQSTSPSQSRTQTLTPSVTPSQSTTPSGTPTQSRTQSTSPSQSRTQSRTPSQSRTQTQSPSVTASQSATATETASQTRTITQSPSQSPSSTLTASQTVSQSSTRSTTPSLTVTATPSQTRSLTGSSSQSPSSTLSPSISASQTQTDSPTRPTTTATPSRSPSVRPYSLAFSVQGASGPSFSSYASSAVLSDSLPAAVFSLWMDRCPPDAALQRVTLTCTLAGVSADSGGPEVYVGLPVAQSRTFSMLPCTLSSASVVALPPSMSVGVYFGTGPGAATLSCDVGSQTETGGTADLARNSMVITTLPTLWPLLGDVMLPLRGGTLRSFAFGTVNATQQLLAACGQTCLSPDSASAIPSTLLSVVTALWSKSPLPALVAPFSITLSGPTLLVLRASSVGIFNSSNLGFSVSMGGVECAVLASSQDGAWLVIRSPNSSSIAGGSSAYAPLALANAAVLDSNGNTTARAARLVCPPFCPGLGSAVPVATGADEQNVVTFSAATVVRPSTGNGAPSISQAGSAASTLGFYYTATCSLTGEYTDPATGACTNASNPASEFCAYGSGGRCSLCPTGGLCPGGDRVWPRPGYYASSELSGITPCPPPDASYRCRGWDPTASSTMCGGTYLEGSYLCQVCSPGAYLSGEGSCVLCPKVTGPWERYQGLLGLFIGIAFFVLCVWLGLFVLTRVAGGTLTGGAARFVSLAIWSITTIQVVSQVSRVNSQNLPPLLKSTYRAVAVLQLEGIVLPPACTGSYAFETEVAVMACALGCEAVAVLCYFFGPRLGRWRTVRALLGRAALTLTVVLYPTVSSAAIGLVNCQTATMTSTAAASLDGGPSVPANGGSVTLSVLANDPFFVCWSGSHTLAGSIAVVSCALYIALFPALALLWLCLDARLRHDLGWTDVRGARLHLHCAGRVCHVSDFEVICWYPRFSWSGLSRTGLRNSASPPHKKSAPTSQVPAAPSTFSMTANPLVDPKRAPPLETGRPGVVVDGTSPPHATPFTPRSTRVNPVASALAGYVSHGAAALAAQQRSSTGHAAAVSNTPALMSPRTAGTRHPLGAVRGGQRSHPSPALHAQPMPGAGVSTEVEMGPLVGKRGGTPQRAISEPGRKRGAPGAIRVVVPSPPSPSGAAYPSDVLVSLEQHAPPPLFDDILAPFLADFRTVAWLFKHLDLCVLLVLSALEATLHRPVDMNQILTKLLVALPFLLALLAFVITVQPYLPEHAWRTPVKALLLIVSISCVLLNATVDMLSLGIGGDQASLQSSITVGSYLLFVLCVVTALALLLGFCRAMYLSAQAEQSEHDAALAAGWRSKRSTVAGLLPDAPRYAITPARLHIRALRLHPQQKPGRHVRSLVAPTAPGAARDDTGAFPATAVDPPRVLSMGGAEGDAQVDLSVVSGAAPGIEGSLNLRNPSAPGPGTQARSLQRTFSASRGVFQPELPPPTPSGLDYTFGSSSPGELLSPLPQRQQPQPHRKKRLFSVGPSTANFAFTAAAVTALDAAESGTRAQADSDFRSYADPSADSEQDEVYAPDMPV